MSRKQKLLIALLAMVFLAAHEITYVEELSDGTDTNGYPAYRTY